MTARDDFDPEPPVPPACRPTVDAAQRLLDGDGHPAEFAADAHVKACRNCRERVRAALLVRTAFAETAALPELSAGRVADIVAAISHDRHARLARRRWAVGVGGSLAVAACVAVAVGVWFGNGRDSEWGGPFVGSRSLPPSLPAPPPTPPARIDARLADAGDALESIGRKIAAPTAVAPRVFAPLAEAFEPPTPSPLAVNLAPAADALADLPEAARSGLEPVTGPAYQAFSYFRDMGVSAANP